MTALHVDQLRHLSAALVYVGRAGQGSCVQRSMALALDLPKLVMTFGVLAGVRDEEIREVEESSSREPFIHAWCEAHGMVIAPTLIERTGGLLVPMTRESYYRVNGVSDVWPVPRAAFNAIARRHGLSSALRHGSNRFGSIPVSEAMLAAAGVRYRLGENRALLPLAAKESAREGLTPAP